MDKIRIKANYSFWKHPIKWIKDMKYRKFLEYYVNSRHEDYCEHRDDAWRGCICKDNQLT